MVSAPHHLAARAGLRVLEDGGNAIEAMIAAAATIVVVYPHMNALGGDNFWLLDSPGGEPIGIDACGAAAGLADIGYYRDQGFDEIPSRGPQAALTVAGALSGWQAALAVSRDQWGGTLPLKRLLEDAVHYARDGIAVTRSQAEATRLKQAEMLDAAGFAAAFLEDGQVPREGARFRQSALAATLERLAQDGLDSFYRGSLARTVAAALEQAGSPLRLDDFERHRALQVMPLATQVRDHRVFNLPPPTQGLASLILLAVYDRLGVAEAEGFDFVHALVEATKQAFKVRNTQVTDPAYMTVDPETFLTDASLDAMAAAVDRKRAAPWPDGGSDSDTVWLGAIDSQGRSVSFIQSLYWEFGSGLVLEDLGITWQNRGTSFSLDKNTLNHLVPGRRPFHTIQPPAARLADGRVMVYGAMGGEGQPQSQAAVFARHVLHGQGVQEAVTAPRWLLGRTWGAETTNLRMENRFDPAVIEALRAAGHDIELTGPFDEVMGHAGAVIRHPSGLFEGAADPRSDGAAAGF
jgi:gamma-glutamyltranspeptidase/glutathione hydrolase